MKPAFKALLRIAGILCIMYGVIEVCFRIYFATKLGSIVLVYGFRDTPHDRLFDPKGVMYRWDEKYANTAIHDNTFKNYSKYFPNQNRIHPDKDGKQIKATINSSGFRGAEFKKEKDPGTVRIITLGASVTFGFKTQDHETFPYQLEKILNSELSTGGRRNLHVRGRPVERFEVINLAIPHMQSDQIVSLFTSEGIPLKPDFVIFLEGYNDASSGPREDSPLQNIKRIPLAMPVYRELRRRSLTFAYVTNMSFGRSYDPVDAKLSFDQGEGLMKAENFSRNLELLRQECSNNEAMLLVANQQAKSLSVETSRIGQFTYNEEARILREKLAESGRLLALEKYFLIHTGLMEALQAWAKSHDVPMVDVIAALDRQRDCLIDWMHLTAEGNRIMATEAKSVVLSELERVERKR